MKAIIAVLAFFSFSASFASFASAQEDHEHRYPGAPTVAVVGNNTVSGGADGRVRVPFKSESSAIVDAHFQNNMN